METISEGELSDTRSVNDTTYEGLSTNFGKLASDAMNQGHEPVVNDKVKITIKDVDEKTAGIASSSFKPTAAPVDDSQLLQPPTAALTKPKFAPNIEEEEAGGLDATTPTAVPMSPPTKLPREPLPRPSPSLVGDETDYNSPPRKRFSPEKPQSTADEAFSTTVLPRYCSIVETKHFNHLYFLSTLEPEYAIYFIGEALIDL